MLSIGHRSLRVPVIALERRRAFPLLIGGLIALAWLTLLLWERSSYRRYLDHGQWTETGLAASLCRALPAGPIILPGLLYVGGWVLMCTAMMLPTTLPLLAMFRRLTERRPNCDLLVNLVILGYMVVWCAFGLAAHLVDAGLHTLLVHSDWLTFNGWIIGAGVLALAGAFQFSSIKHHCLEKCRTPFSFVNEHWRGRAERWEAFSLGVHHGIFCVGCCWAIMSLMFLVGTGSVGWMFVLGAFMAFEKNMSWGRRLSAPVGAALLLWSGALVAEHLLRALV
jgi:predicted metal-binding membrane protein